MTIDEFKIKKAELNIQEENLIEQESIISKKLHENHQQMRDLYYTYVSEHMPYKEGDVLEYTFVNREGDQVTRIITIKEINTYMCDFSNIILYYEYTNNYTVREDRIDWVKIDGTVAHSLDGRNPTLKKID